MVALHTPEPLLAREPRKDFIKKVLTHFRQGNRLFDDGDPEAALREYEAALDLVPRDPTLLNNRGVALNSLGRHEEALATYDRLPNLDSKDAATAATWHNRGMTLAQLSRFDEAVAAYNRALEIVPEEAGTLANRGLALAHMGRYREALNDLDRALPLRQSDQKLASCRRMVLEELLRALDREGVLSWAGGKPAGSVPPIPITAGPGL